MIWKGEQNMKKWIRVLPVLGAAVLLTVGFGHQTAQAKKGEHPVIADRIFIGDVAVGGMTKEEAVDAVQDYVQDLGDKTITLPSMMFLWRQQQRNWDLPGKIRGV